MRAGRLIGLVVAAALLVVPVAATADPVPYVPPTAFEEPSLAELPTCPVAPESLIPPEEEPPPEEELAPEPDPVLVELRELRIDQASFCKAVAARQDEVLRRVWWLVEELNDRGLQTARAVELLTTLNDNSCGNPCATYLEGGSKEALVTPAIVEKQTLDLVTAFEEGGVGSVTPADLEFQTAQLTSSTDAAGEASKAGLWFIAAVILLALLAYPIYKAFIFWRQDV